MDNRNRRRTLGAALLAGASLAAAQNVDPQPPFLGRMANGAGPRGAFFSADNANLK